MKFSQLYNYILDNISATPLSYDIEKSEKEFDVTKIIELSYAKDEEGFYTFNVSDNEFWDIVESCRN